MGLKRILNRQKKKQTEQIKRKVEKENVKKTKRQKESGTITADVAARAFGIEFFKRHYFNGSEEDHDSHHAQMAGEYAGDSE